MFHESVLDARVVLLRGHPECPPHGLSRGRSVRRHPEQVLAPSPVSVRGGVHHAYHREWFRAGEANGVGWLEEPFPAHDYRSYAMAAGFARVPLAAGENHYTRFEFHRLIEDRTITILQPDLSKTGGITETLRIAALASAWKLPIHPHSSMTGLNMAAAIHLLAAIDNGGYFGGRRLEGQPVPGRARDHAVDARA